MLAVAMDVGVAVAVAVGVAAPDAHPPSKLAAARTAID
jgi:hypothetical protein